MVSKDAIVVFLSEFDLQVQEIERAYTRLKEKVAKAKNGPVTEELVESIGYWLHNLYSAYEDTKNLFMPWLAYLEDKVMRKA